MNKAKEASSWLLPVIIGLVVALIIRVFFVSLDRIDGPSMLPNLVNNERVLCLKQAKIHRGSVVIFNANGVDPQASGNSKYGQPLRTKVQSLHVLVTQVQLT